MSDSTNFQDWIDYAENDWAVSKIILEKGFTYGLQIGYALQQSAEKFLKALLVKEGIEHPKTHNIEVLIQMVSELYPNVPNDSQAATLLTHLSVRHRYPSFGDIPDETDIRQLQAYVGEIRGFCRAVV